MRTEITTAAVCYVNTGRRILRSFLASSGLLLLASSY